MARRAGLAVRADRLRRGLIRRRHRQPQNIRSSRAADPTTRASDRAGSVLAPNMASALPLWHLLHEQDPVARRIGCFGHLDESVVADLADGDVGGRAC
jgi:hypothetical protein